MHLPIHCRVLEAYIFDLGITYLKANGIMIAASWKTHKIISIYWVSIDIPIRA